MPGARDDIRAFLNRRPAQNSQDCVLVEVTDVKGSAPRNAGAWMLVARDRIFRTIGGGQLEYMAIDHARKILAGGKDTPMDVPLGPEIGQCCGGRVGLSFKRVNRGLTDELVGKVDAEIATRPHVYIFGAGHVGNALAHALSLTPVRVVLVDTREAELMACDVPGVETCLSAMPEQVVRSAPPGSAFIILTHDHALDFLIAAEALQRRDAVYVGMIGSKTKKATFKNWLKREVADEDLFENLVCPVGGAVVKDKRPEVIAALAAAEVLTAVLASARVSQPA
ncbi:MULTISPECIES: xanthine dehydrogenase accessory protein XdhC [Brucella/Ochrobactrum group]|jgi:xanthine dehydrogenase accessory factor|uniref:Xanthine dehydrogenase accessory protein XdhC n=1 Tax=Brucella pseudintermedia TaxID=370111 RepID=A0ABY5UCJ0_9HYPH|nr:MULTISPECIES: xanthine dehydrogenase accessory protein XdhC [Brucella/Ochrobactrum group]KAB2682131.1 xanthine dehydrogenase accessory protein XdhC [Brucella pseudintermedia]NKE75795.1 xanthine dehydrogenase accessory protein XdhC [Ochrobactrum sp. MC-1LL]TWH02143.1 xanthine dehydrogenase accessory factor [Ochrobactrum sp. J50]UWL60072.1 xanthine dehydrogenase accessory protein XdhC [Brucella pseudintermedia]WPM80492.1 xanthine dehydrogenase accessory protein XdhC [Brucella pseudintermedia]